MFFWKKTLKLFVLAISLTFVISLLAGYPKPAASAPTQPGDWTIRTGGDFFSQQRLSMADETNGWVLAFSYTNDVTTAYLIKYEDLSWSISSGATATHSQQIVKADIEMISANDGWLVLGGGLGSALAESSVFRWDGSNWNFFTTITDPNGISLTSLDALSANSVWALGGGNFWGTLYHWNGSTWNYAGKTPGGVWADDGLDMLTANDGWAVGYKGAIAHWDGTTLVEVTSPTTTNLTAVSMVDSSTGWAVGEAGTILVWDGSTWTIDTSPTTANLHKIQMISADEGWIVGSNVVLYWDGIQWSPVTMPVADNFRDIDMLSASDGWMIGDDNILQYDVPVPQLVMNYISGAPSSYFTVIGTYFPANGTAEISVNGRVLGTVPVNSGGVFYFQLSTDDADEGIYYVTASVNPTVTKQFILDNTEPVRPEDLVVVLDTFAVPAGIVFNELLYLPSITRD